MELYRNLGPETHYREYKEAVLRTTLGFGHDNLATREDIDHLKQGFLTQTYFDKITQQTIADLYHYIPRYLTCFFNSPRRQYYSWYYGVTDDGTIAGLPIPADNLSLNASDDSDTLISSDQFIEELVDTFNYLTQNQLAIVIDKDDLQDHIKKDFCNEEHRKLLYKFNNQWVTGYTCHKLKDQLQKSLNFQTIPLIRPTFPLRIPKFIEDINKRLIFYQRVRQQYENDQKQYLVDYADWNKQINYYGSKINTLLSDSKIVEEIRSFIKQNYELTKKDECTVEKFGDCFRMGNDLVRNPPFLDIFRAFRDYQRERIQQYKPKAPKAPKNVDQIASNRLGYAGYLLIRNPDVNYLMLRCNCQGLKLRTIYRCIYYDSRSHHWVYQRRQLRMTPGGLEPYCGTPGV